MKIRTWKNAIKEGFRNLSNNRAMSLASISAITASLFVLGLVMIAVLNMNTIITRLEQQMDITVILKDEADLKQIAELEQEAAGFEGVYDIKFVSREQALEDFKKQLGDVLDHYGPENNPLPNTFYLKVLKPEYIQGIVDKLGKFDIIEEVNVNMDIVGMVGKVVDTTRLLGFIVFFLLIVMSMLIINNTIKISVYSRRREINIMKYIGATDWYIRWPFIIEGITLGFFGALVSGALISGLYKILADKGSSLENQGALMSIFRLLPINDVIFKILGTFIVIGSIAGFIASYTSVRKHLDV